MSPVASYPQPCCPSVSFVPIQQRIGFDLCERDRIKIIFRVIESSFANALGPAGKAAGIDDLIIGFAA
jgi:hypothetical protein